MHAKSHTPTIYYPLRTAQQLQFDKKLARLMAIRGQLCHGSSLAVQQHIPIMYEIRHNGVPRSYRDLKSTAFDATRFAKRRCKDEIIEIVDMDSGAKILMLEDGRIA